MFVLLDEWFWLVGWYARLRLSERSVTQLSPHRLPVALVTTVNMYIAEHDIGVHTKRVHSMNWASCYQFTQSLVTILF